jgi:hypothetical protein
MPLSEFCCWLILVNKRLNVAQDNMFNSCCLSISDILVLTLQFHNFEATLKIHLLFCYSKFMC